MTWKNKFKPAHLILFLSALTMSAIIGLLTRDSEWVEGLWVTTLCSFVLFLAAYQLASRLGASRLVVWAMAIGFILRMLVGIGLMVALPLVGQPTEQQQAGYIFLDAYKRDTQAQKLAASEQPIHSVYTKGYASDQYGGYLGLSMFVYRYISPDPARPSLMILLSAWAGALAILFFWLITRRFFTGPPLLAGVWLFTLYPASVLMGATQMREPYLICLSTILIWSVLEWLDHSKRSMMIWAALASLGILLISPGILLPLVISLAGWWVFSSGRKKLSARALILIIALTVIILVVFAYAIANQNQLERYSLPQIILKWFALAVEVDMELSMANSGRIAYLFQGLPVEFQPPFILLYGVLQPVLPAALLDKTLWISNLVSSLLAAGWYWLLPLLVYAPFIRSHPIPTIGKRQISWIIVVCWFWILFCSLRAGGDQWDNPRYRTIFIPWLAFLAAWVWEAARQNKFFWLKHIWLAEAVFLLFFTQWYASRYHLLFGRMSFPTMVVVIVIVWVFIFSWAWVTHKQNSATMKQN